ncbi:MAG: HD domain-containing phosphohydrolase [Gemmatimonadota bacterium]
MTPATTFLTALGQALAAQSLYSEVHPMRRTSIVRLHSAITNVLQHGALRLSFLEGDVIAGTRAVTDLRGWEWGAKLSTAGIQRLELSQVPATRLEDVSSMLGEMHRRLSAPGQETNSWSSGALRMGPVAIAAVQSMVDDDVEILDSLDSIGRSSAPQLGAEIAAVNFVHDQVERGQKIPMAEVDGIVRALAATMRRDSGCLLPLLDIRHYDEYTTSHCCNVAMLSMGIADQLGLSDADSRAIGSAALLHDIGKTRISKELLTKPGALTPEERLEIQRHPVEGARILTDRGLGHGLAATVAYEHHIWFNGKGGYPHFDFPRQTHFASRIVHVSDIFDAVSSKRPYHDPWPREKTLTLIRSLAGIELDPVVAEAFLRMVDGATEHRLQLSEQAA